MKTHKKKSIIIAVIVLACLLTVGGGLGIWAGVIVDDVYFANREDNLRYQAEHLEYLKNVYYADYTSKGEQTFCNFNLQEALDSGVKYNEVAFLATHNSYQRLIIDVLTGENATGYLYFQVSDILPVQNLMENLLYTLIHDSPNRRNINQTTMGLLFLQLLNYTDRLFYEDDSEEEAVVQVLQYIENHYNDGSLSECAELLHYDFYWLSREIKKQTGKNYTDLLQEKRMAQAAFLLKTTKMNVADIALTVGYENVSYFHRLFGKTYNISPKKYRDAAGSA